MNEGHANLLATKWYDHKKLAELGESEGTALHYHICCQDL